MFNSKQLADQFLNRTVSVASVETMFGTKGHRGPDVVTLHPGVGGIDQVVVTFAPDGKTPSQNLQSVQIEYGEPFAGTLAQIAPAECKQWTMSATARMPLPFKYLCDLGTSKGSHVRLVATLTAELADPEARVQSLAFVR